MSDGNGSTGCVGCLMAPFRFVFQIFLLVWGLILALFVAKIAVLAFIVVVLLLILGLAFAADWFTNLAE